MLPTLYRKEERNPVTSLRGELDRLFEDFFGDGFGAPITPALLATKDFAPVMDLKERDDAYVAELEMPGMKAEEFKVEVLEGVLSIRGERKQEKEEKTKRWHRTERLYGSFERRVALPNQVDAEKVDAAYKDGVLTVTVPKAPGAKPKTIQVRVQSK
jgi:HSP20 family protein